MLWSFGRLVEPTKLSEAATVCSSVNYGLLYCVAATCHQIGKIVNESSYRVAKSSQSFTELSRLVIESSCHRIGQLTNRPVPHIPKLELGNPGYDAAVCKLITKTRVGF